MKTVVAFLKLIRWPNLVFIALTQVLFRFFVLHFVYGAAPNAAIPIRLPLSLFWGLVLASVCIAAAGYIINDYFDVNIDLINKPDRLILEKFIKRRWAIVWHSLLSLAGLLISCFVGYKLRNFYIPVVNFIAIAALWLYSTTFKKKLLIGNVIISLLTAWVILVLTFSEFSFDRVVADAHWKRLIKMSVIYAGFAFIISLVREVIKDMEDMTGDAKYGCTTMPIVWGIRVSKVFAAVWIVVIIGIVTVLQFYLFQSGWWLSSIYSLVTIIVPLCWVLRQLYRAQSSKDFHQLSRAVKWVMFTGILTMVFF